MVELWWTLLHYKKGDDLQIRCEGDDDIDIYSRRGLECSGVDTGRRFVHKY